MDVMEETRGDVTYIRTDRALPPVAVVDRTPMGGRQKLTFTAVALIGAIAWAVIAFVRGETVNAVWFVVAAMCTYVIGFRFYARLIEMKIVQPRDEHATPAEIYENGTDYLPTDRRVLFGHHFAAIAGAGPLVGPVLATQMGYLPGTIWILLGAVFAGCVQDYPGALDLHPPARPLAGADGARRTRPGGRNGGDHRGAGDHGDPARRARAGGGQRPGREPVGRVLHRDDDSDRHLHGPVSAVAAAGPGHPRCR